MKNTAYTLISIISIVTILVLGKELLIPFIVALLFWFLTREIRNFIKKIPFLKRYLPNWLNNTIVLLVIVISFGLLTEVMTTSISGLIKSYKTYQGNIALLVKVAQDILPERFVELAHGAIQNFNYLKLLTGITNSLSNIFGNILMIVLYALFIFAEESVFEKKLRKMIGERRQYSKVAMIIRKVEIAISDYLRLKTIVSLLTGILSYSVLKFIGVDSSLFWAFLIFLLNFIPTIGSLMATIFPAIFGLIQFGNFSTFAWIIGGVGVIQLIIGNFLEPKVMGKSLNLSPLVAIGSLAVWGKIWGITGMLLSVPVMVVIVIIFSQFEKTRGIAILLSENGTISIGDKSKIKAPK